MHCKTASLISSLTLACLISTGVVAQQSATEAPAGFSTPTLAQNPGSQSTSNGVPEPPGDSFAEDQAQFEKLHDASTGLGPLFNAGSCAQCHQNGVTGAASQITELRVGHLIANGTFANPTILINNGTVAVTGRSIVNDRAICDSAREHVPNTETIQARRAVLSTLGDGFVEAVPDETFLTIAASQAIRTAGQIHGEPIMIPILESSGKTGIGKFGWKDQQPTVLSFAGDAYLNEMGVTNRLRPKDVTSVCKMTTDPEDAPDSFGLANIDHFAQFIRGTMAPPRDTALAQTPDAQTGAALFEQIGCSICHVSTLITAAPGTLINGGTYTVSAALGNKIIHPYGDFLLHDVGTGDGIVQGGPADTGNKLRTAPLWGLHIRSRYMHDLGSLTLEDAIERHGNEANHIREAFGRLNETSHQQLITFLKSL